VTNSQHTSHAISSRRAVPTSPGPGRSPAEIYRLLHADDTEFREAYWFLHWGPTTDNLSTYAYLDGDVLVLVFAFYRGPHDPDELFVGRVPADEFVETVEAAARLLEAESGR
jgi:hypothetical protein